jgi:hypothetical protein
MSLRRNIAIALLVLAAAAMARGLVRGELKPLYLNAVAVCYSCIGLE